MALKLELKLEPDAESRLREVAATRGQSVDDYVTSLVELSLPVPPKLTGEAWEKAFREYLASHKPIDVTVDDSRESIYEGRGE
jgi:hypothetical protein